jgi:SAM-dependent methyltransferase
MEPFYPLHVRVCEQCLLVQLDEYVSPSEIFGEYAYFSSYSSSWVEHARRYVEHIAPLLDLSATSFVVELASNDGYLLQHLVELGVSVLGVEPAANVAERAIARGVPSLVKFFGVNVAREITVAHGRADLIVANNVLAHVPDINDFVGGIKVLLKPGGTVTMEFPHLARLVAENQFDTIYHEHFSYLSLLVVRRILARHDLAVFDVEELSTHGGSLRVYARHAGGDDRVETGRLLELERREIDAGFGSLDGYGGFQGKVDTAKRALLTFLIEAKRSGKKVAAYGAPGKGNTLLNYCGIRTDFIDFAVDANPYKQGKFTPGTRIPILAPKAIREARPDYVLILPWNLRDEISHAASYVREWGARFVVPIPEVSVF